MKLVKTKLLLKHDHNSAVGVATAPHIDFCKYQFRCLRPQGSFNEYVKMFMLFIELFFALLSIPFLVLTHGLLLYPFWIVIHIMKVKKIIKEFGVEYINSEAEKLVKEFSEKKISSKNRKFWSLTQRDVKGRKNGNHN